MRLNLTAFVYFDVCCIRINPDIVRLCTYNLHVSLRTNMYVSLYPFSKNHSSKIQWTGWLLEGYLLNNLRIKYWCPNFLHILLNRATLRNIPDLQQCTKWGKWTYQQGLGWNFASNSTSLSWDAPQSPIFYLSPRRILLCFQKAKIAEMPVWLMT